MHLLARELHGLDDAEAAVDLEQTPADVVFLSYSDSELALLARLHEERGNQCYSLRCASLAKLKHPFSIDLYLDKVARHARLVVVRLLGGKDYWPYGVEQLATLARSDDFLLAATPGDGVGDARLRQASTLGEIECRRIWSFFQHGGAENLSEFLNFAGALIGRGSEWIDPAPTPAAGTFLTARRRPQQPCARALLVFYRSLYLAGDVAPIVALADSLAARGLAVEAAFATSLKGKASEDYLAAAIGEFAPDVIINTTAFSARGANGGVLDRADVVVLQAALATSSHDAWAASKRGANGADLAMNVVLPEVDGRIFTRAISFKTPARACASSEFQELRHAPKDSRIDFVAQLAKNWALLRRTSNAQKKLALILSDYPARRGRSGYAIGLDVEQSVAAIMQELCGAGYDLKEPERLTRPGLIRMLEDGAHRAMLPLSDYRHMFASLPASFTQSIDAAWGAPEHDPACDEDAFQFSCVQSGKLVVALQPDRGLRAERRETYHDVAAPPRHAYVAFYFWLRHAFGMDAMIHLGAHGSLEWLPGKSVMLDQDCAPEVLLGATPTIYPFIVNNPGEAAQAKRRLGAVAIGHLTPPLIEAQLYDDAARIEQMLDEYANAATLDPRRAKRLSGAILDEAQRCGLMQEAELGAGAGADEKLAKLDAWLCDIKELRIGDGLHVFARAKAIHRDRTALKPSAMHCYARSKAASFSLDLRARPRADAATFCPRAAISIASIRATRPRKAPMTWVGAPRKR